MWNEVESRSAKKNVRNGVRDRLGGRARSMVAFVANTHPNTQKTGNFYGKTGKLII
jgi:hypothetical protein